jgi:hypothetical protein
MCDKCTCNEELLLQDSEQVELTDEQLIEMLGQVAGKDKESLSYFREPLEFDDEEMSMLANSAEFIKGTADATYWAGYWNTLLNMGLPEELALEMILTQMQNIANEKIQTMNVDMNKEMSKNQVIAMEKNQL